MAQLLTNPNLGDFFEFAGAGGLRFDLADIRVVENLPLVGKRLDQTDLRSRGGIIVGIRKADGSVLIPPPSTTEIQTGDNLFAIGNTTAIAEFTRHSPLTDQEVTQATKKT
ncbi:MAG: TrkA C-terminal domain-containing protein [Pirellulaceae bacterium]|nr:TrkA C-terminal domain-containing protein [Pirellulaceae bacterium]